MSDCIAQLISNVLNHILMILFNQENNITLKLRNKSNYNYYLYRYIFNLKYLNIQKISEKQIF
jgi:hypothetical protein